MFKHLFPTILWVLLVVLPPLSGPSSRAEGVNCVVSSGTQKVDDLPSCADLYPDHLYGNESSPWRIGFGAGIGERTNPLINSHNIPIYGIVQLSYFGDQFFFDNGDIGWYLAENKQWSLNAIAGVGGERSFFSFLNSGSIGFNPTGGTLDAGQTPGGMSPEEPPDDPLVEEQKFQLPERDYTIDGGVEYVYHWDNSDLQIQLLTDLSGRYKGQEIWVSWAIPRQRGRWEFIPSVGLNWKSSDTANYYYGVTESEASEVLPAYDVGAVTNAFGRLAVSYTISEHWKLVSVIQYERLARDITRSPIVEGDSVKTGFVGLYYEF